jgi:hypothetical protein
MEMAGETQDLYPVEQMLGAEDPQASRYLCLRSGRSNMLQPVYYPETARILKRIGNILFTSFLQINNFSVEERWVSDMTYVISKVVGH